MSPFEAYSIYTPVHRHFTSKYDYFKYNGKLKTCTVESYKKRPFVEQRAYTKLADMNATAMQYCVAVHSRCDIKWAPDIFDEGARSKFLEWKKYNSARSVWFVEDLKRLSNKIESFNELFILRQESFPTLLSEYMRNSVAIETVCIIDSLVGCVGFWERKFEERLKIDPLLRSTFQRLTKYRPFVEDGLDRAKFKKAVIERLPK